MMENNHSKLCDSDISSFRIVNVDHYMSKPVAGLDPIYSEFRGCDIKQVPVIRVFGTNLNGDKTCLHVHGVFPYMYIPYDGEKGTNVHGFMHQIANSLDKAINISLGYSQAASKHIFNISLVKGIPFYGYHSVEHQFLKIYFFNPFFVKRSAKLLQNGAIMNQIYQAHEAHVPYVLNFFIDYNLYGMSFLHVPSDEIRYRRGGSRDDIHLDPNEIQCQTISKNEIDVTARSILNRLCYQKQTTEYLNPGISSIWQDERIRRENMDLSQVPPLTREVLEERFSVIPTESDLCLRSALEEKLKQTLIKQNQSTSPLNGSILQSTQPSNESLIIKSRKFDLQSLIGNAVYPAESTQLSQSKYNFIDASFVQNPYEKLSTSHNQQKNRSEDVSIINENIVLSLSQNNCMELDDTITGLEREILEEMDKLENQLTEIEMDSILAPLSQSQPQSVSSQKSIDGITTNRASVNDMMEETRKLIEDFNKSADEDPDDDLLNDFSIALESDKPIENSETKTVSSDGSKQQNAQRLTPVTDDVWDSSFWNNIELPQIDGASDCLGTPRKQIIRRTRSNVHLIEHSPKSPRSTRSRYTQLDVQVIKSPKRIKREMFPKSKSMELDVTCVAQKHVASSVKIKIENEIEELINPVKKKLKLSKVADNNYRITRSTVSPRILRNCKKISSPIIDVNLGLVSRKRSKKQEVVVKLEKPRDKHLTENSKAVDVAEEYDKKNNFFPVPGPSKLNSYAKIPSPQQTPPNESAVSDPDDAIILKVTESVPEVNDNHLDVLSIPGEYNEEDEDFDERISSFYDKTIIINSPDEHIDCSSPLFTKSQTPSDIGIHINRDLDISSQDAVVISLKKIPPSYTEVLQNLTKYKIPEVLHSDVHYSLSNDVTSKREIGMTVLKVPFKSNCDEFTSCIDDLVGINKLRRNIITKIMNVENGVQMSINKIREFLANEKSMVICPAIDPPTKQDAIDWLTYLLNSGERTPRKNIQMTIEEESPVSIRREKVKMILGNDGGNSDCNENAGSDIEITFSPLTPSHSERTPISFVKPQSSVKSTKSGALSNIHKAKFTTKARLSLTKKFNQMKKNRLKNDLDSEADDALIECGQKTSQISNISDEACSVESTDSIIELFGLAKKAGDAHRLESIDDESNRSVSDISGPTLNNTYGFKMQLENFQTAKAESEFDYLTIVSLEIFTKTRQDLKPNPEYDPIMAIFYSIQNNIPDSVKIPRSLTGLIVYDDPDENSKRENYSVFKNSGVRVDQIFYVESERNIFEKFLQIIEIWDPDIFVGYEIEMASWGYLIERGNIIELNMAMKLSRIPSIKVDGKANPDDYDPEINTDEFTSELKIPGRIILDAWRLLRHEIALTSYTFENIMYHILHRRYPVHSHRDLTRFWNRPYTRWIVLQYYIDRCYGTLEILDQLDLVGRTCELAKLFGIQFYEVLSRGSQFRVESMMLRMAKPRNFVAVSPSIQQRAHMRAPEYLPLILEPESRMYLDPLIVLDFQSLYPSMMIGYNYCFSTCLGRVENLGHTDPFEFGASHLKISKNLLKKLLKNDLLTVSPCGVAFVKSTVREGTVPRMLKEILDTRQMVKQSMKLHKNNKTLQRVLHSRQLGLKLIANVTYGYTAANFSGRMPCIEVADSVVSKGRETLERAIKMVESNENWRCKVVYGDTDSLFVLVPGRDRKEAFRIGEEISKAVTNDNPQPVKLKLEKVYQPSILQTKKRYVGYMYETADQEEPVYEAKGIETVRRDGCPAVAKMLEKTIRILFDSKDVSLVKKYICRQFSKILSGRINIQDLVFAKEFRGINGYKPGACVPSLELTRKWQITDKRAVPRRGERVPFIIANGPPGLPLIRLVRSPYEMLSDEGLKINSMYYINKVIVPPLNRCLLLIGVDANEWIPELPRKQILLANNPNLLLRSNPSKKSTISQYFSTNACISDCGRPTNKGVCDECRTEPQKIGAILCTKAAKLDRKLVIITRVCQSCCGRSYETICRSLDCPVLYKKNRINREHNQTEIYREILKDL